ncbi:MAG: hypothetical protein CL693_04125, partial [Cellvibrionaceae bacterium]|nr:hypothetical protein [Cellvibrionaceae bacterium]
MTQQHPNTASATPSLHQGSWFNLHIEGCGNLYNARWVEPGPGRRFKRFLAVRIALLQGPTQSPEPMFLDLKVTGDRAKKIIEMYFDHINDREAKTFASIKFSDLDIQINPNAKQGHQPYFMKGRLINVKYLKVADQNIDLSDFDSPSQQAQAMSQQPP